MDLYPFFIFCAPNFIRYSKILVSGVGIKTFMKYFCELSSFILDTLERVVAVSIVFKRQKFGFLESAKSWFGYHSNSKMSKFVLNFLSQIFDGE